MCAAAATAAAAETQIMCQSVYRGGGGEETAAAAETQSMFQSVYQGIY